MLNFPFFGINHVIAGSTSPKHLLRNLLNTGIQNGWIPGDSYWNILAQYSNKPSQKHTNIRRLFNWKFFELEKQKCFGGTYLCWKALHWLGVNIFLLRCSPIDWKEQLVLEAYLLVWSHIIWWWGPLIGRETDLLVWRQKFGWEVYLLLGCHLLGCTPFGQEAYMAVGSHTFWVKTTYSLGTVNSKSFVGKVLLQIKQKFKLMYAL